MKKSDFLFNVRDITEIGILCGLAIVLDMFVKIPIYATGGSISIAMLPLIFIALHKGWFKGFVAGGLIFGLATCLIDGYGIQTFPLDYLLGFGSVAIVGLFRNKIVTEELKPINYFYFFLGIFGCMLFRFAASTLSGMIIYEISFVASMLYQITYIGPTFLAILLIMLPFLRIFISLFKRLS